MTSDSPSRLDPTDQGYVPVDEWPAVTRMVEGFGAPSLPASDRLVGRVLDLRFDDGSIVHCAVSEDKVAWDAVAPGGDHTTGSYPYRAVAVRPGILFLDFVRGSGTHSSNVSLLVDLRTGQTTAAESSFVDRRGAMRMSTSIRHGVVGEGEIVPRSFTGELVGKRIYYRYSPTEHYEHVYLNAGTFVWHCVRGGEAGLADADPVQVIAVDDGLVLLHWSETVMPVESIVAIDLTQRRSIGRMFCWDGPTLQPVRIPFDSEFEVLSETTYPTGGSAAGAGPFPGGHGGDRFARRTR